MFMLLTGCGSGTKVVFSSRTSPDGSGTAQNIVFDDAGGGTVIALSGILDRTMFMTSY
jgi:hypothetical protein